MLDMVTIDQSENIETLPEGEYKVNVVDAELKTSQKGNPYLRWQFTVFDHVDARYNGKAIWHSTPTSGKGFFRLAQLYRAATKSKIDDKATSLDPKQILGKQLGIMVVNSHDAEGNPTGYTEVKNVKAL